MTQPKHIHLIGICGTAMASLAGMLKQRGLPRHGFRRRRVPADVRLPRADWTFRLPQPFAARNLDPTPDLVVVGNAMSRGNVELEHVLDQRIPFCSLPQLLHDEFSAGKEVLVVAGTHGKTTTTSMLSWIFHSAGLRSFLSDRRHRREFRFQLSPRSEASTSFSKATNTTPPSSTRDRSFSITFPTRSF